MHSPWTDVFHARERIEAKSTDQVEAMRAAGLVVAGALALLRAAVTPGVRTDQLDRLADTFIRDSGATPSFTGYLGYPATICVSVNDEVVHGIPGSRVLGDGDLVSIDCGAIVDGWHGDAAFTAPVGEVDAAHAELVEVAEQALWSGIAAMRLDGRLTDIGHAVETVVRSRGSYGIVEEYVGHGIGREMHMDPQVPNVGRPGRGPRLVEGATLAIEPMVTLGSRHTRVLDDGWTVVTADGSWAAHVEHTVAVTAAGPWVLTEADGGAARLGALGVRTPASAG